MAPKFGGGGGGGGSSSSTNTTSNADKRLSLNSGAAGISGDNSSITINSVDSGIVSRALDSVDIASANTNQGLTQLIAAGKDLFSQSQSLIGQTQKSVADAYGQAQTDKAQTIDNKTIIVLALTAAGVVVALFFAKGKPA